MTLYYVILIIFFFVNMILLTPFILMIYFPKKACYFIVIMLDLFYSQSLSHKNDTDTLVDISIEWKQYSDVSSPCRAGLRKLDPWEWTASDLHICAWYSLSNKRTNTPIINVNIYCFDIKTYFYTELMY